jgi:photosystem II stability/assembly factor-like uncharacterized protein
MILSRSAGLALLALAACGGDDEGEPLVTCELDLGGSTSTVEAHPAPPPYALLGPRDVVGWTKRLVFDPSDPAIVYAGQDDTMGLFRSSDGGATWSETAYGPDSAWALDVDGAGRVYAGDLYGTGIHVSTDGGASFTRGGGDAAVFPTSIISAIDAHPTRAGVAFASVGEPRPHDGFVGSGVPLDERGGLLRTTDAGATWTRIDDIPDDQPVSTVYVLPGRPEVVLVGRGDDLWRSTDGGERFARLGSSAFPFGVVSAGAVDFAASAERPDEVVAAGSIGTGILVSHDAGETWAPAELPPAAAQTFYYSVAAAPDGSGFAAFGGLVILPEPVPAMLIASADDLERWTAAEVPGGRALFTGAYLPGDPSTMLVSSIGDGVFRVAGGEWSSSSAGLLGAGCESIAVSPEDPDTLFVGCANAGFFDQLARSTDGGASWERVDPPYHPGVGQEGLYLPLLFDRDEPGTLLAGGAVIRRTTDLGASWSEIEGTDFTTAFAQASDGTIVAVGPTLRRSSDHGRTWTTLPGLACGFEADVEIDGDDRVFVACPENLEQIGFWRSDDLGDTWTRLDTPIAPDCEGPQSIALDPTTPGRVAILTLSPFSEAIAPGSLGGHVHVSDDDGATWRDVTPPVEASAAAYALSFLSDRPGHLLVGTNSADLVAPTVRGQVWESVDVGATWWDATPDAEPDHVWLRGLVEDPRTPGALFVSTWYRGWYARSPVVLP